MLKITSKALLPALLLLGLAGCSWFKEKPPEYVASREVPRLQVPPDLDEPRYPSPLMISAPEMRIPTGDELNPGPPRTVSTGGRADANAFMSWSAEGVYLKVLDTPDSVNRRLGFAIERSGMQLLEGGEAGDFRFQYNHRRPDQRSLWQKMKFWSDGRGPDYSGTYRARVSGDGDNSRVYLMFDSGEPATTSAAEHVLGLFMERLG
jgi:uncharacterized lipoprotein